MSIVRAEQSRAARGEARRGEARRGEARRGEEKSACEKEGERSLVFFIENCEVRNETQTTGQNN